MERGKVRAEIIERPDTFDRVDRVKWAVNQPVEHGDNKLWILGSPLVVDIDGDAYTVPKGFTTDGASIPEFGQFLTGWDPWEPPQRWAAICHDWLYTAAGVSKRFADSAFHSVLVTEGANMWQCKIMYLAVVIGGGPAYRSDQREGPKVYNADE